MFHWRYRPAQVLLLAVLWWFPVVAQEPSPTSNSPETSTRDSPVTFRTGANLVLVPVVVRDRQGRAVRNLRREDFQLQDKGEPQIISRLAVESRRSATAIAPPEPKEAGPASPAAVTWARIRLRSGDGGTAQAGDTA